MIRQLSFTFWYQISVKTQLMNKMKKKENLFFEEFAAYCSGGGNTIKFCKISIYSERLHERQFSFGLQNLNDFAYLVSRFNVSFDDN